MVKFKNEIFYLFVCGKTLLTTVPYLGSLRKKEDERQVPVKWIEQTKGERSSLFSTLTCSLEIPSKL